MEQKIKELEKKLSKFEKEKNNKLRFFTQYLLSPILVVMIGVVVNLQIEQEKKELQQIKIAQSMLSTLFSEDEFKAMATQRLMNEVLQNESLKKEIEEIVSDYMNSRFIRLTKEGDYEKAINVYNAVKTVGGSNSKQIATKIKANKEAQQAFSKYEIAKNNEKEGFEALTKNDFPSAIKKFKKAYEVYPQYHSVAEIYKLLKKNKSRIDNKDIKKSIFKKIVEKYSWKAPQKSIKKLRKKID